MEITNMERVLHGLSSCGNDYGIPNICEVTECPYREAGVACVHSLAHDAMAVISELLKAQEPRLMTLEEIWKRGDNEPLYLEYRLPHEIKLRPAIFQPDNSDDGGGDGYMCVVSAWCASGFYNRKEYGNNWRCWTSRPTDEQRKAVKWDG